MKEEGEAIGKTFADSTAIGSLAKTMEELAPIFGTIGPVLEVFASAFKSNQLEEILQAIDALKARVVGVSAQMMQTLKVSRRRIRGVHAEFRGYMNEVNITQRFFDVYNSNRKNVAARRAFLDQCAGNKCGDLALNLLQGLTAPSKGCPDKSFLGYTYDGVVSQTHMFLGASAHRVGLFGLVLHSYAALAVTHVSAFYSACTRNPKVHQDCPAKVSNVTGLIAATMPSP